MLEKLRSDDLRRSSGDGGRRGDPDDGDGEPRRSLERRFLSAFAGVVATRDLDSRSGVKVDVDVDMLVNSTSRCWCTDRGYDGGEDERV